MVIGTEQAIIGLIAVADEVRESSRQVIERLHQLGIKQTIMLTGDNQATAEAISHQTGVKTFEAELLPENKLAFIKKLKDAVWKSGDGW